jgi:sulfate permease, SulP family
MAHQKLGWHLYVPKIYTTLRSGYNLKSLRDDTISGLTVAIVALPLAMALAIASGTSPEKGLVTAIVAGFLISLLGGSRFQIGGPTGAFVVVVFNVIHQFGYDGLVSATILAGGILVLAGILRLGTFIKYIPHPVVTGFTSGIALIIMLSQINDFLGLNLTNLPADFVEKATALFHGLSQFKIEVFAVSLSSLGIIFFCRKYFPKYPAFLIAIALVTIVTWAASIPIETIGTKFGGIPSSLPSPTLPNLSWEQISKVFPSALTIAFLAGIESLLSAVVADGMTGTKHRSNCELIAQGVANTASALFTGMPATGAIARTATNIRSGAKSPVSGIIHALSLLIFIWFLAPLASYIPLACLSAVLMIVAWNMSEFNKFIHLFKAPMGDRLVLVLTFLLTVLVDLNVAIEVGVVLSSVLFMHRMANAVQVQTHAQLIQEDMDDFSEGQRQSNNMDLPEGVLSYQLNGPIFFGAAERLIETLGRIGTKPKVVILQMRDVPFVDATGCTALSAFVKKLFESGVWLILSGANSSVIHTLNKMKVTEGNQNIKFSKNFYDAHQRALEILEEKQSLE